MYKSLNCSNTNSLSNHHWQKHERKNEQKTLELKFS